MNGFEKRRQEKKDAILAAARDLFVKNGIDVVKITDVAREARVSKVSIYNYFGSKEELSRQVLCNILENSLIEFKEFLERDISFKEKFEILYEVKIGVTDTHESFYKLLSSPKIQQYLSEYYETKSKPLLLEFIEQGKREGYIDRELSDEAILKYYESSKIIATVTNDKKMRSDLTKLFFYGFRGK